MATKHLRKRTTKTKGTVWDAQIPSYISNVTDFQFDTFSSEREATAYVEAAADAYDRYKRRQRREIYMNKNSVEGLINAYKETNSWNRLTSNTKRTYNQLLRGILLLRIGKSKVLFKDMMANNVKVSHAEKIYKQLCDTVSMHRANHTCKVLRRIWFVGRRLDTVQVNPFEKMGLKKLPDRKVLWEPSQVDAYIDKADELGWWSMGTLVLLTYDLCQRPGDMRQLTWDNYEDGVFDFVQEKTGTDVTIPASPRLLKRLAAPSLAAKEFIVTAEDTRKPYDRRRYNKISARIRREAGLPDHLQIRDLRRTGATEMAEAGCTEDELRSVTGHQSRDVLSIYVRPTQKLAAAGINKRFKNE